MGFFGARRPTQAFETSPEKRGEVASFSWFGVYGVVGLFYHFRQTIDTASSQIFITKVHKMDTFLGCD
jgi:hypothetical protein